MSQEFKFTQVISLMEPLPGKKVLYTINVQQYALNHNIIQTVLISHNGLQSYSNRDKLTKAIVSSSLALKNNQINYYKNNNTL